MRCAVSCLSSLVLVATLLFAPTDMSLGEDLSESEHMRRGVLQEWTRISNGRTEFDISDPALLPNRLALVAGQSGCRYKEEINAAPVHFMRLEGRRLAIVFCFGVIGSHQVFDLSNLLTPRLFEFPFLAQPKGFGTTAGPGWMTWDKETGAFVAETGSDLRPSPRVRHTYRFDANQGFVVVRVELQRDGVGEWTTIWDAPSWSIPATLK